MYFDLIKESAHCFLIATLIYILKSCFFSKPLNNYNYLFYNSKYTCVHLIGSEINVYIENKSFPLTFH